MQKPVKKSVSANCQLSDKRITLGCEFAFHPPPLTLFNVIDFRYPFIPEWTDQNSRAADIGCTFLLCASCCDSTTRQLKQPVATCDNTPEQPESPFTGCDTSPGPHGETLIGCENIGRLPVSPFTSCDNNTVRHKATVTSCDGKKNIV